MLKYISTTLKAGPTGFSAVISTPQVDLDGESVDPLGIINRAEYMTNPLVYWAHEWAFNPSAEPIGKATRLDVFKDRIESSAVFAPTPKAQNVKALVDGGFVSRTSVGFDPIDMEMRQGIPTHSRWALREYSVVPMPANPGAVITGVKSALEWLAENFDPETLAEHRLSMTSPRPGTVSVFDGDRRIGKAVLARKGMSDDDLSSGAYILASLAQLMDEESEEGEDVALLAHAAGDVHTWLGTELAEMVSGQEPDEDDGADPYGMDDQQAAAPIQLARRRIAIFRSQT